MRERKTDLFGTIYEDGVDAICITTNGQYTDDGLAAMGGGCAGVCARRWPQTPKRLGSFLRKIRKNIPYVIGALDSNGQYITPSQYMIREKKFKCLIFSFPTIDYIMDGSNLTLIKQSALLLKDYADHFQLNGIVCGRPGVGIGGCRWSEVKSIIEPIFDDRFTIVSFEHEEP